MSTAADDALSAAKAAAIAADSAEQAEADTAALVAALATLSLDGPTTYHDPVDHIRAALAEITDTADRAYAARRVARDAADRAHNAAVITGGYQDREHADYAAAESRRALLACLRACALSAAAMKANPGVVISP